MVGGKPVRDTRAAVVRQDAEARKAVMRHDGNAIECHLAFAVGDMGGIVDRSTRIAIATQIHRDDRKALSQSRCHTMPDRMRLRMTMKQQQRRTATANAAMQSDAVSLNIEGGERSHGAE